MKLHELLDKPEKWTKGSYARNANGTPVASRSLEASCWCVQGGWMKLADLKNLGAPVGRSKLLRHLQVNVPTSGGSISHWNDASTYEEVFSTLKSLDI